MALLKRLQYLEQSTQDDEIMGSIGAEIHGDFLWFLGQGLGLQGEIT